MIKYTIQIKALFLALSALVTTFASFANDDTATDYQRLENKAKRFFDYREWASANAMYLLMLEQNPRDTQTYAHAVVAEMMTGDTIQALDMATRCMNYEIAPADFLSDIRNVSFSIGNGRLYEEYLLKIKKTYPWYTRIADNFLMQYYGFRQNGPELIKYADTMLQGLPDDRDFLRMLARGQLLDGNTRAALDTWEKTIRLYPDDYDTTLDLANTFDALDNRAEALKWMERAFQLRPTPYVRQRIETLKKNLVTVQNR